MLKYELIDKLNKSRKELMASLDGLTDADMERKDTLDWTVKDLLSRIVGWDEISIADAKSLLKGQPPKHLDEVEDKYNKKFADKRKDSSPSEILDEIKKSTDYVIAFMESLADEELNKDRNVSWKGENVTIAWLLDNSDHDRDLVKRIWEWRMKKSYDEGKEEKDYGKPA